MHKIMRTVSLFCMATALPHLAFADSPKAENPWEKRFNGLAGGVVEADVNTPRAIEDVPPTTYSADAYMVTFRELQENVSTQLTAQGAGEFVRALIARREDSAAATYREPLDTQIDQLTFDEETKTWSAVAYFSAGAKTLAPMKIAGRYELMAEVPVLKERVSNGQPIEASNIEIKTFGTNRLREHTIASATDLIGKTPKHSISALRPIRADEVITAPIVKKGENLNITYKTNAMEISTLGQAMEDGAAGDVIKIRNPDSNTIIQATITGKGTAQIRPAAATTQIGVSQ